MRLQPVNYDRRTDQIDMIGGPQLIRIDLGELHVLEQLIGWEPYTHLVQDWTGGYFLVALTPERVAKTRKKPFSL